MPFSIQGIGTALYGERDIRRDHSYIATEWIIIFCLPIIPIRSLRIKHCPSRPDDLRIGGAMQLTSRYLVLEKRFPNWKQVLSTYAFVILSPAWVALVYWSTTRLNAFMNERYDSALCFYVPYTLAVLTFWLPFPVPSWLWKRARRRAGIEELRERSFMGAWWG